MSLSYSSLRLPCAFRWTLWRPAFFASAISICLSAIAAASTPTVVIGNWNVPTGASAFTIPLSVTGGDPIDGGIFLFEISQDGIFKATGGPNFVSVNLTTGGIFSALQIGPSGQFFSVRNTNTSVLSSGAAGGPTLTPTAFPAVKAEEQFLHLNLGIAANGPLGNLVISTVGVTPGVYDLRMTGMVTTTGGGGTSTFFGGGHGAGYGSFANGTITVVPEPSTFLLAAFGFIALALLLRRRSPHSVCLILAPGGLILVHT